VKLDKKRRHEWQHRGWRGQDWSGRKGWPEFGSSHGRWNQPRRPGDHSDWNRRSGCLFVRFVFFVGFIILLFLGGLAAAAFLLTRLFGGDGQMAVLVWIVGCGLALALPVLAIALSMRVFRRYATPLVGVMEAADAVAEGDFSVRLAEEGSRDFRQLARSFNRMTQELDRTERQRRNLTADVAHELRTPLHIIQGNLEGLLDGVYQPSETHIEATLDETRLLSRLVEDLQTLSLAEAGQLELVRESVDVTELLADVKTSFSGQAEAAGVTLEVAVDGDREALNVWADYGRLDQVLGNLLANALRYTPSGGTITLSAAPNQAGAPNPDWVRIQVVDSGRGIPAEDLPYIFDRFWRGDPSRPHGGSTGLGLAIAQQLVRAHDGQIGVESEVGQGTIFTIELPGGVRSY
jgi:two-component system OmpR family sensor kinase/two-component system sensor histidine kinase BaeS